MAKQKNKKIYVEYLEIDCEKYEQNRMRIAKNNPKYDDFKYIYLYELFNHKFLEEKIKNQVINNFSDHQFYDSFFIQLDNKEFDEIQYLFKDDFKSDLELCKTNDDTNRMLLFLNASVKIAQKDPKFWET